AEAGLIMGADRIRARAARHAVMARLVPDCRCCGKSEPRIGQKAETFWPVGATKTRLGCVLAIFSVPGPPWPRLALGGAPFLARRRFAWRRLVLASQDIHTTRAKAHAKVHVALSRRSLAERFRLPALVGGNLER